MDFVSVGYGLVLAWLVAFVIVHGGRLLDWADRFARPRSRLQRI